MMDETRGQNTEPLASGEGAPLVLSLFPGIGLLDMAFELEGFCVVRGPDVLWGGDIRRFHPPAGRFDGVIGGPPCQAFSGLKNIMKLLGVEPRFGNLIPEFERCVRAARPAWFVMENVTAAPIPAVTGYAVRHYLATDWKCGGQTQRKRRFSFGSPVGLSLDIAQTHWPTGKIHRAVTGNCRIPRPEHIEQGKGKGGVFPGQGTLVPLEDACERQGLPRDFRLPALTVTALRNAIGNGVPLPMGRAIAKAVMEAITEPSGEGTR
jgi:DNA (cytosine-5)-methyltransferase 1